MLHLEQLAEIDKFSRCFPVAEIGGRPMALYNPASGAWTDMIWAGGNLLGEVTGSQAPEYRLLDHEGSLVATTDSSGNVTGTDLLTPYGQAVSNSTSDFYLYTGLDQDAINGSDHAWYRNYSTAQSRWLRPDPYNGSYDLYNPQSFNRYNYVENNPLEFIDPRGLNENEGLICSFDPASIACDPSAFVSAKMIFGSIPGVSVVFALATIACSIDYSESACGPKGWASVVIGGTGGKVIGDTIAVVGMALCLAGVPDACLADMIYTAVNELFGVFWDAFGPAQFTGSLLPRPADLSGLGTSSIGIPNKNLSIKDILGQPSSGVVPSPEMSLP